MAGKEREAPYCSTNDAAAAICDKFGFKKGTHFNKHWGDPTESHEWSFPTFLIQAET